MDIVENKNTVHTPTYTHTYIQTHAATFLPALSAAFWESAHALCDHTMGAQAVISVCLCYWELSCTVEHSNMDFDLICMTICRCLHTHLHTHWTIFRSTLQILGRILLCSQNSLKSSWQQLHVILETFLRESGPCWALSLLNPCPVTRGNSWNILNILSCSWNQFEIIYDKALFITTVLHSWFSN